MKKLASIFAMMLMVLTFSISLNSCSTSSVAEELAELNKECPHSYDADTKIVSAAMEGSDAVLTFELNVPSDGLMSDEVNGPLLELARCDSHLVDLLKAENKNLILRIKCPDDTVTITIRPDQL
ncbi:MAG: hypothetical protein II075_09695 [Bacteroidales bacterium]|jgi:hypothetical protein|nr:hypothetical protein [Bacteroidales bacterium]